MTTEVVVELVIDSSPAVSGANAYVVSMDLAAASADKLVSQTQKVDDAIAKQAGGVTRSTERLGAYKTAYERLVASVDPAARAHAAYERAVKTSENAVRRGITTTEEAARTLDLMQRKLLGISDTPPLPDPIPPGLPRSAEMSTQQLANLQFQLQDVGQALLTGQPAFTTLIQQGSQIVQTMDGGAGVTAALKKVGAGLLTYLSNPLNLAVLGFAAFVAGAQSLIGWLFKSSDSAKDAESATDVLADTVDRLRDAYGEATVKVKELADAERIRLALLTETQLQEAQRQRVDLLGEAVTGPAGRERINALFPDPGDSENGLAMKAAIDAFVESVRAGNAEATPFREALERIMFAADEPAIDDLATTLLELISPLAENEALTTRLSDALIVLTQQEGEAVEAARARLGVMTKLEAATALLTESANDARRANDAAGASGARSAVQMLELRRAVDTVAAGYIAAVAAISAGMPALVQAVDLSALPGEALRALNVASQDFQRTIAAGAPDVIAFREAIATVANLDPENAAVQAFTDALLELTANAAGLQAVAEGAAPIKTLGNAAAATKPVLDSTTLAIQQLKEAAEGGIDQAMAKSLYQAALAAAATKEEFLKLQAVWAAMPFNAAGPAAPDIASANIIKNKAELDRLEALASAGSSAETVSDFDQATEAITRQIRELELDAATFGLTADAAALFRVEMQLLDAALEDGIVTDAERAKMDELIAQFRTGQEELAALNAAASDGSAWTTAKGYFESFAQSMVSGLGSGKTMLEAVEGAVGSLGSSLRQAAVKDLFAGNFGAGIIKGIIGLVAGFIARRMRERRELEAAREAWAEMSDELAAFADRLAGHGGGSLAQSIADATAEMQPYIDAAKKAKASTADLEKMLEDFAVRASKAFMARFPEMIGALESGLGSNSPAIAAAENVANIAEELQGFIADTKTAKETLGGNSAAVRLAEEAAQSYALSLLRTPQALSEVETEMLRIQGTASELQSVLVDLGMSASEAAAAISDGVAGAIGDLRAKFSKDLGAKINDALGKGYLNEVTDLVAEAAQLLSDATLLGLSGADVSTYFAAQAQAIVDGAGLTGDAFLELIGLFPQLAGVVHEASGSVEEAMERINDAAAGVLDYVRGLLTGSSSTLSPEARLANAQAAYDSQIALAQGGDVEAQSKITDYADALLEAARTMFASSTGYQNIFARVTSELLGLPAVQATTDPSNVALRQSLGGAGASTLAIAPSTSAALFSAGAVAIPAPANDRGSDLGIRQNFVDLMQVTQGGANAQIVVLREQFEGLRSEVREVVRALSVQRDQPRRAGGRGRWGA